MSCYSWEEGTIKIPAAQWASFRKKVLTEWNRIETQRFKANKNLYERLKVAVKGKRGSKKQEAIGVFVRKWEGLLGEDTGFLADWDWEKGTYQMKTKAPKQKDFNIVPVSKSATLRGRDFTVSLKNETKEVVWSVHENNHAVEEAHKDLFVRFLFKCLQQVTWTRNSGGEIVGNDEYNQDCGHAGGGANYVTHRFSVEEQKRQKTVRASSYSYGGFGSRW